MPILMQLLSVLLVATALAHAAADAHQARHRRAFHIGQAKRATTPALQTSLTTTGASWEFQGCQSREALL